MDIYELSFSLFRQYYNFCLGKRIKDTQHESHKLFVKLVLILLDNILDILCKRIWIRYTYEVFSDQEEEKEGKS